MSPKFASNIGAIARTCANFEALDLWLVAPRCFPHSTEAYRIAVKSRVMDTMKVVDTLHEALADVTDSIGFSRRDGRARLAHPSLKRLLQQYPDCLPLFCYEMRTEAQEAAGSGKPDAPATDRFTSVMLAPAASSEIEALIQRWSDLAAMVGLGGAGTTGGQGNHARKRTVADHVRSLLQRGRATTQEVRVLHGLCSAFLKQLGNRQA
ncbi:hypothetical protein WJX72_009533 [[Myrmecia] bisecta]|uniref:tRNA/rRNA methyltransferase SpoU type domain-containing protein n=1 Tax=[Myrmecia] bisecta TaxID=41462 RepID=A0AAW1P209_9CHLO